MLILFDIDGTLLLTRGEGIRAMHDAGCDLFGPAFGVDGVEFSGRLDPLIIRSLCERNSIAFDERVHASFRERYGHHLRRRLDNGARAQLLPGVGELIDELRGDASITIGLVTGNYPETGQLKIERAGLAFDHFRVFGWGIDGPTRRHLPPVAIAQYEGTNGGAIERSRVIVIGDTPHDVDCARHNGCRSLAVATGLFDCAVLNEAGADFSIADLSDTESVMKWIHSPATASASASD